MANTNYEDWNNSELADALTSNEEFLNDHVAEGDEDNVWQWDRSDLIDYANEYLNQ